MFAAGGRGYTGSRRRGGVPENEREHTQTRRVIDRLTTDRPARGYEPGCAQLPANAPRQTAAPPPPLRRATQQAPHSHPRPSRRRSRYTSRATNCSVGQDRCACVRRSVVEHPAARRGGQVAGRLGSGACTAGPETQGQAGPAAAGSESLSCRLDPLAAPAPPRSPARFACPPRGLSASLPRLLLCQRCLPASQPPAASRAAPRARAPALVGIGVVVAELLQRVVLRGVGLGGVLGVRGRRGELLHGVPGRGAAGRAGAGRQRGRGRDRRVRLGPVSWRGRVRG